MCGGGGRAGAMDARLGTEPNIFPPPFVLFVQAESRGEVAGRVLGGGYRDKELVTVAWGRQPT